MRASEVFGSFRAFRQFRAFGRANIHALALSANGRLYAVHKEGRLKVLDTAKGSVIASRKVPAPMWDGLAIASGRVFLSTLSGEGLCLGESAK